MFARLPAQLLLAVALSAVFAAGFGAASAAEPGTPAPSGSPILVSIRNYLFYPAAVTIKPGNTVTWRNDEVNGVAHTVVANKGAFTSGNLGPGMVYSFTFTKPGVYAYTCSYHPYMTGTITVGDEGAPAGSGGSPAPSQAPAPGQPAPPPPSSGY
jgi:manganese oxidase